jgi:hypothetical protein
MSDNPHRSYMPGGAQCTAARGTSDAWKANADTMDALLYQFEDPAWETALVPTRLSPLITLPSPRDDVFFVYMEAPSELFDILPTGPPIQTPFPYIIGPRTLTSTQISALQVLRLGSVCALRFLARGRAGTFAQIADSVSMLSVDMRDRPNFEDYRRLDIVVVQRLTELTLPAPPKINQGIDAYELDTEL